MELNELLKAIKTDLRKSMNGIASKSMRDKGLEYKLNFGVELPRVKEIASHYEKNHSLAQALWKENIRECKILAGLLQPIDSFFPEIADIWVEDIQHQEIAELTCMNLFRHLPYASEKAFQWMADEREFVQVCGFLLMARLFIHQAELNERAENEYLNQATTALIEKDSRQSRAAFTSLRMYIRNNKKQADKVLQLLLPLKQSSSEKLRLIYEELKSDTLYD